MGEAMADNDYLHIASIMEAAMSFVDNRTKTSMDLMSKFLSLMGSMRNYKKTSDLAAFGFENQKIDAEGLLAAVRPLCRGRELAFVDQILSMFQAKKMFETYKVYMDAMKGMQGFSNSPFGDFMNFNSEKHDSADQKSSDNNKEYASDNPDNSSGLDFTSFFNSLGYHPDSDAGTSSGLNTEASAENYFGSQSRTSSESGSNSENDFNTSSSLTSDGGSNNMMDMLKAMIPSEQKSAFENLSMLFNNMSYDNNKSDQK
jgi:hypothetical protein